MKRALLALDLGLLAFIFGCQIAVIWGADERWAETAYMAIGPLLLSAFGWLYIYYRETD